MHSPVVAVLLAGSMEIDFGHRQHDCEQCTVQVHPTIGPSIQHPAFTGAVHQPGRDIWFRVLDNGHGQSQPDRMSFVGFEGSAGIVTSAEYGDLRIWPDDDARTNPVIHGNILVWP